jgi:H/ACA ribonucleoprotein complex subunit 3
MKHIHLCNICSKYTMKEECPSCGGKAVLAKPPKYSPEDKYGKYRRETKEKELQEKGLL